jgi:hypothetical protein
MTRYRYYLDFGALFYGVGLSSASGGLINGNTRNWLMAIIALLSTTDKLRSVQNNYTKCYCDNQILARHTGIVKHRTMLFRQQRIQLLIYRTFSFMI